MNDQDKNALKKILNNEIQHSSECDQTLLHGYRVFLAHHIDGDINLLNLIEQGNVSEKEMIDHLLESGNILQDIHDSGYLHHDFTLEHVIYDLKKKKIRLTELEFKVSIEKASKGVKQFHGTPGYIHPLWLMSARREYIRGGRIKYSVKNDVYAYLHAADLLLQQACLRANNQIMLNRLRSARSQIQTWKNKPFEQLPALQQILCFLKQLKAQPKQTPNQMAALNLHKQRRLR
jgi:serine/threonine protein kinase